MINKVKWKNHDVLGNLELDFTKDKNRTYSTIVIVGENGTGKTSILSTLANFLSRGSFIPFDYIEYDADGENFRVFCNDEGDGKLGFHSRLKLSDGSIKNIHSNISNNPRTIDDDKEDIRKYGVVYSAARSGFRTNPVNGSTTQQLDSTKYDIDDNDDFTSIKQLLVDLDTKDNSDWMEISRYNHNLNQEFSKFDKNSRMNRFSSAFNSFFENLKFYKIDYENKNKIEILFSKNEASIPIDRLSTGEKQIVFRGAQLLRNARAVENGIVLIDEPELSMHPRWQDKILDYYLNISSGKQNQRIITTHSEYVLRAALRKKDVLVIVLDHKDGVIKADRITAPNILPTITFAETNYLAFKMPSTDYHIQLYGYLQEKENKHTILDCDKFIRASSLYNAAKHEKLSTHGTTQYYTLPTYIRNAINHPDNGNIYTAEELETSIEFLIELCNNNEKMGSQK